MSSPLDREHLAVLVHEARSPVAALAAISGTFADAATAGADRAELARLAVSACNGLERIVVDAVTTSVRREPVSPTELVRDVVATASLGGARVVADVEPDLPAIAGDPVRLRQALDNLVANALVHSGTATAVVVGASRSARGVGLFVRDEGTGIPSTDHGRILEAGERLDRSRPGSGLGLAIVSAIVGAHGGELTVVSQPGDGATFTIELPVGRGSAADD